MVDHVSECSIFEMIDSRELEVNSRSEVNILLWIHGCGGDGEVALPIALFGVLHGRGGMRKRSV